MATPLSVHDRRHTANPSELLTPPPGTALALPFATVAHPRQILPNQTYLITRRCYQRTFRLRPSALTNQVFLYCLAFALRKTGVRLHAACVMSNHHHLVVTDPNGVLPDFLRELHRLTAKALNASQGQWENLWAAEPCNVVRLVTDADVDDKIAYVVANPVAGALVKRPEQWPGVLVWGDSQTTVSRPATYFSNEGTCPAKLELVVEPPPQREERRPFGESRLSRIVRRIDDAVTAAHQAVRESGRTFLGRTAVLSTSFARRARSYEVRFGKTPTFAAREKRVRDALRKQERHFRACYREAFERWRRGERSVEFPHGTWGIRVVHGAGVAPPLAA